MKKDDGRRPMKGFEKYYELTRGGMVYSMRLKRFIKHKVDGMTGPYITYQVDNKRYNLGIGKAIFEAWASENDRAIVQRLGKELRGKSYDEVKPVVLEDPEVQVSNLNTSAFLSAIMVETKKTAD